MNVTMPLAEVQKSLASITRQIKRKGQRVVLETRGKPQVALISLSDLEQLQNGKHHIVLEHEWPALLVVLRQLRAALQAKKYRRAQQLLEDIDDFLAMVAVADEPTRPWEEFIAELETNVSHRH